MGAQVAWRVLIVEDDAQAAAELRSHLVRYGREHGTSFSIVTLGAAFELLEGALDADIVFLDIKLPGINGMEAAQIIRLRDEVTPIIFVTDLAQYALQGYSVDALDFMVKPVSYDDFALRMRRAMKVMARNSDSSVRIGPSTQARIVRERDIVYVEVLRHNLYWHLSGEDEPIRQRGTISAEQERLSAARFCRISASHLINMGHVRSVKSTQVTMDNGNELAITRTHRQAALEQLAHYAGEGT